MADRRSLIGLAGWMLVTFAAAAVGGVVAGTAGNVYAQLVLPSWAPPGWAFGVVWPVLYACTALAAWRVWRARGFSGARWALGLYLVQLALNAAWTWHFFSARESTWALIEMFALWSAIVATLVAFWRIDRVAGVLFVPYLAWVSYAAALTGEIRSLNPSGVARPGDAAQTDLSAPPSETHYRGIIRAASGGLTFRECESDDPKLVFDSTSGELADAHRSLASGFSDSIYAELRGRPAPLGEPPGRYDAALHVTKLGRATPVGEGGGCDSPRFPGELLARGNEPFWSVSISRSGIIVRRPAAIDVIFPYVPPRAENGRRVYTTSVSSPTARELIVVAEERRCSDTMSGARSSFTVRATLDGETYTGCAHEGGEAIAR